MTELSGHLVAGAASMEPLRNQDAAWSGLQAAGFPEPPDQEIGSPTPGIRTPCGISKRRQAMILALGTLTLGCLILKSWTPTEVDLQFCPNL